jgi:hypothetical protein
MKHYPKDSFSFLEKTTYVDKIESAFMALTIMQRFYIGVIGSVPWCTICSQLSFIGL